VKRVLIRTFGIETAEDLRIAEAMLDPDPLAADLFGARAVRTK